MSKRQSNYDTKMAKKAREKEEAEQRDAVRNAALGAKIAAEREKMSGSSNKDGIRGMDSGVLPIHSNDTREPERPTEEHYKRKNLLALFQRRIVSDALGSPTIENPKQEFLSTKEGDLNCLKDRLLRVRDEKASLDTRVDLLKSEGLQLFHTAREKSLYVNGNNKEVKEAIVRCKISLKGHVDELNEMKRLLTENSRQTKAPPPAETAILVARVRQGKAGVERDTLLLKKMQEEEDIYLARVPIVMQEINLLNIEYHLKFNNEAMPLHAESESKKAQIHNIQRQILELENEIKSLKSLIIIKPLEQPQRREPLNVRQSSPGQQDETVVAAGGWARSSNPNYANVFGAPGGTLGDGGGGLGVRHDETATSDDWIADAAGRGASPAPLDEGGQPNRYAGAFRSPSPREEDDFWDLSDVDPKAFDYQPQKPLDDVPNPKRRSLTPQSVGLAVGNAPGPLKDIIYTVGNGPPAPP